MDDKISDIILTCEDNYNFLVYLEEWSDFGIVFRVKAFNLPNIYVQLKTKDVKEIKEKEAAELIFEAVVKEFRDGLRR